MRRAAVTFALAGAFVWPAATAGAHAVLRSSEPPDGARLERPPAAVVLAFTEEPELAFSQIRVLSADGRDAALGAPGVDAGDPRRLRLPLPALEDGVYTTTWRVVSKVDGHATGGAFAFGVRATPGDVSAAAPAPSAPSPSPLETAGRWLLFAGLGVVAGAGWVGAVCFRRTPGIVLAATGWALLASVAGLLVLGAAQRSAAAAGVGELLGTSLGRALIWRAAGIAAASLALLAAWRGERSRRPALALAAAAAAGAMLAHVSAGHAAAVPSMRWAKIGAQWLHFLAAGVWIGGLAALLAGVRGEPRDEKGLAVRRFSQTAAVALAAVAATGIVRALNEVGSWGALTSSGYGRTVMAKAGVLVVLAGLGAANRYRSVPEAARSLGRLRRISTVEIGLGATAMALAALLATQVPPKLARAASAEAPLVAARSDFATTLRARLEVRPGFPGRNEFRLAITDFDTREPVAAQRVALFFRPRGGLDVEESSLELASRGDGIYTAPGSNLSLSGRWGITVLVQRGAGSVEIALRIATRCRTQPVAAAGQPTLYDVELGEGGTAQGYLDPGEPGLNEAHFTYFDEAGNEMRIGKAVEMSAARGAGEPARLVPRRLGPGHFVAEARLTPGRWRFEAQIAGGTRVCFEEEVE